MFPEPVTTPKPVDQHESNKVFYDRISHVYDMIAQPEKPHRQAGVVALNPQPGETILELGFGTGDEVRELADRVGASGTVAGIDVSAGMLEVAQKKLSNPKPAAKLDLRVGDARVLPWPDAAFDAVYTSFTLELFPEDDIRTVLAEVKRVLKPGGRIGVVSMAVVKAGDHPSVLERGYIWMHRHFPHLVDCRPIDASALVAASGFTVTSREDREIWTMPVQVVVAKK